ncbi:MAG TPA: hypothetical protein PK677_16710 [Acidiphilium sp.]|nr:hypothetical protein [Acidiphilium sp.]
MALCSFIERRRQRYYFRVRVPTDIAPILRRTHLIASLQTGHSGAAKLRAAKMYLVLTHFLTTMRIRMLDDQHIDGRTENAAAKLVRAAFELGQHYQADVERIRRAYDAELRDLIENVRAEWTGSPDSGGAQMAGGARSVDVLASLMRTVPENSAFASPVLTGSLPSRPSDICGTVDLENHSGSRVIVSPSDYPLRHAGGSWRDHLDAFYRDKPGLTDKTRWSYDQAFTAWADLIGAKPIAEIRRGDVKLYADYLRDRPNKHGGQLHQKSILRSLGHIKNFMRWAVTAGLAFDDRFEAVQARSLTSGERLSGPTRRAITEVELECLFRSRVFVSPRRHEDWAVRWFLAIAALSGARTEEIARAPALLVRVGDIDCIDLRDVGRKTCAAPRLIPVLPDLANMGLREWAAGQAARGYSLVQSSDTQRTASAWSKLLNRYLNANVADDPQLVLYSLRHSFRQMLRASGIGDELADKVFGHSTGNVGARYGRDLSAQEARSFVDRVRPPVNLRHLLQSEGCG